METNRPFRHTHPFTSHANSQSPNDSDAQAHLKNYLLALLYDLDGVEQGRRYHPECDALYHSLQVFQLALDSSHDPELWAVALLHDVGKAVDMSNHANIGADQLDGLLSPRIVWLIQHHLDLLIHPKRTRSKLKASRQLQDLENVRRWDLGGRKIDAVVMSPEEALTILLPYFALISARDNYFS